MRLRREKNMKKLNEAIQDAGFWKAGSDTLLKERKTILSAVEKAENRQKQHDCSREYFKSLKEVKKRARLLGYSEKEIEAILDEIYWPDGRPTVRVPQS